MFKLNNKGQTLVLFVVLLPIFLFIIVFVVDVGNILSVKQDLNNINYMMVDYGLDNMNDSNIESEIIKYIQLNSNDLNKISVDLKNNTVSIYLQKYESSMLGHIFNIDDFEIVSSYKGTIKDGIKSIERVKWYYGN